MNSAQSLTQELKRTAHRSGFDLVGACPAVTPNGISRFKQWLEAGYGGQMHYLGDRATAYEHPRGVLENVRSMLILGMNYRTAAPVSRTDAEGRVSRYAWGPEDYHDVIHSRLGQLIEVVHSLAPDTAVRGVVDTAPLLEREFAQAAGLGWIGKNTLLLNRDMGSWFFLAALLTEAELEHDLSFDQDHCGSCRACLDACPTGAFPEPYVLDATRCISYLTIELRDHIPAELRPGMDDWIFGCDVCQEVCPWNQRAPISTEPAFQAQEDSNPLDLVSLFELDDESFRRRFRKTPLWRARRRGLLRNAAIVLGNHPVERAEEVLIGGLNDDDELVRVACAWALSRYKSSSSLTALDNRRAIETDVVVIQEIDNALWQRREKSGGRSSTSK